MQHRFCTPVQTQLLQKGRSSSEISTDEQCYLDDHGEKHAVFQCWEKTDTYYFFGNYLLRGCNCVSFDKKESAKTKGM